MHGNAQHNHIGTRPNDVQQPMYIAESCLMLLMHDAQRILVVRTNRQCVEVMYLHA